MPTYTISAPDGKTYSIDGPPGASDDQVRAQVLAQHPTAGSPAQPSFLDKAKDWASRNGRGLATTAGAMVGGVLAAPEAALAAVPTAGLGSVALEAGGLGLGGAIGGNLYDRFTGQNRAIPQQLKAAVGDTAINAAGAPAGRLLGAGMEAAAPYVAPAAKRTATLLAKPFKAVAKPVASYLDAGAAPAADAATQAAQVADAHAGNLVGEARGYIQSQLDPLDSTISTASQAKDAAISKATAAASDVANTTAAAQAAKDADAPLRAAMMQRADIMKGVNFGAGDTDAAKGLVAALRAKLNPTGAVATIPNSAQSKVYQDIIDTLAPSEGPKPDLETVQTLRRLLAKPAYTGDVSGAAAIDKIERRGLVGELNKVEDAYTGGLQKPVQENYAKALDLENQAAEQAKVAKDVTKSSARDIALADKTIADATKARQTYVTQLESLDNEGIAGSTAISRTQTIVQNLRKNGLISEADHREFVGLLSDADAALQRAKTASETAAALAKASAARKQIAKNIALLGAGAVGAGGVVRGGHAAGILP